MYIKEFIIKQAQRINIDLIGFVKAEKFHELKNILIDRDKKEYLSNFEEKDIQKRINPKLLMENAKTIIVIGVSYNIDIITNKSKVLRGKISKSSLGIDYHIVLRNKMENLCNLINKEISMNYKYYVDTGPLVDRHLAYKAGIGWYGKNNCIINDKFGSWIYIGYIICDLEIEPDIANARKCLECDKCIKVCPTGALMDNYEYNAKRCISYLTQTKDDIDFRLREKMTEYIYGCDRCQNVCPHNEGLDCYGNEDLKLKDFEPEICLWELLEMSKKDFKKTFGNTSMAWRGLNILKRNALIIIGNSREPKYLDRTKEYLAHPSPMIRKYCAWAILRLDYKIGREILENHLKKEKDDKVILEINKLIEYYH